MTIHLGPPPPPLKDNHRVCDHNAMLLLAFPQEQISHYTTACRYSIPLRDGMWNEGVLETVLRSLGPSKLDTVSFA